MNLNKYNKILNKLDGKNEKPINEIEKSIGEYLLKNFEIKEKKSIKLTDIYIHYIKYLLINDYFPEYLIGKQKFNIVLKQNLSNNFENKTKTIFGEEKFCIWSDRPYVKIKNLKLRDDAPSLESIV